MKRPQPKKVAGTLRPLEPGLQGATVEHFVDDGLHVVILVARLVLLEGRPVIAEDLFEGVFVDPLPCGGHRVGLYHVLAPRSTR